MNFSELKYLKELSWYTTIPLFVCAWMMQDIMLIKHELSTFVGFLVVVGKYYFKVVSYLFISYIIWLFAAVKINDKAFPFTLLLATYILTLAVTGLCIYLIKPSEVLLPVNIIWFIALVSLSFNLYQIQMNVKNNTYSENDL